MARRSARLASASKQATASPAPRLGSVAEELTPTHPPQAAHRLGPVAFSPVNTLPTTPAVATPVKLPMSEMHPSKVHHTTAAPSSGLKLGFSDIDYTKKPTAQASGVAQSTPSKTPLPPPSTDFTFRYTNILGHGDQGLSPEAKKLMGELREDAVKIKAELAAKRDQEKLEESDGRKIRRAKGKAGRYSAAHMAEFKKMDSIENHPSAFRAAAGRATPVKGSLKRSQSKANLDDPDSTRFKKASVRAVQGSPEKVQEQPESPVKRIKKQLEDDVSTIRPVSRDGSFLPRPKSSGNDSIQGNIPRSHTFTNVATPTKSALARSVSVKTPNTTLPKSPSKPDLRGFPKSASRPNLASLARTSSKKGFASLKAMASNTLGAENHPTHVQTPGRFDRVKSILKRQISESKPKSNIPQFVTSPSKTSLHQGIAEEQTHAPLTTPARKLERQVGFTPSTKRSTMLLNSPSPVKSNIPRSKTLSQLQPGSSTVDKSASKKAPEGEVTYPDLSAYCRDINENTKKPSGDKAPESVPGTFTFRSDHTIRFDSASPEGFGGAAGQASIRHIRNSTKPISKMPGSFPTLEGSPNKENKVPSMGPGIPHGMSNKKRHRANWDDEEDDEANQRTAKKARKNPPAEGHALVAPRLLGESPSKKSSGGSYTPSPQKKKKKGGLSLSRLNMLARPKTRK
ncbi:hypothetical protein F4804DRAFT_247928 [Jackrogersella minutella]|nr:hypothetical protein F4804DRAFT_247928 [Jackrogersella minutella]